MKKVILLTLILLCYSSVALSANTKPQTLIDTEQYTTDMINRVMHSTVKIENIKTVGTYPMSKGTQGTGFYIDSNTILTNDHVVQGDIRIITSDGRKCTGERLYGEDTIDLAIIRTDCTGEALTLTNEIRNGQDVYAIGNPAYYDFQLSRGIISKTEALGDILVEMNIVHGYSGGPLFNQFGEVNGVVKAIDKNRAGIGFAVASKDVRKFMERAGK